MLFARMTFCLFVFVSVYGTYLDPKACTMLDGNCACPVTFSCGANSNVACPLTSISTAAGLQRLNDGNGDEGSRFACNNPTDPCWIRYELESPALITGFLEKGWDGDPVTCNKFRFYVGNDSNIPGTNQLCYSDAGSTTGVYSSYNEDWTHSYLNKSCNIVGKYLIAYSVATNPSFLV